MRIQIGSSIPDREVLQWDGSQIVRASTADLTRSGKSMVLGVVGAFTPVCSETHLKDYLAAIPSIRASGIITNFLCFAAVDPFVLRAWGEQMETAGAIDLWSDPDAEFAKAIDITADYTALGLGLRSGRYSMLLEDGVVERLNVEDDPDLVSVTGAETLQDQLNAA